MAQGLTSKGLGGRRVLCCSFQIGLELLSICEYLGLGFRAFGQLRVQHRGRNCATVCICAVSGLVGNL